MFVCIVTPRIRHTRGASIYAVSKYLIVGTIFVSSETALIGFAFVSGWLLNVCR